MPTLASPAQQINTTVALLPDPSLPVWAGCLAIGTSLIVASAACQHLLNVPAQSTIVTFPRSLRIRDLILLPIAVLGASAFAAGAIGASSSLTHWPEIAASQAALEAVGNTAGPHQVARSSTAPLAHIVTLSVPGQPWQCEVIPPDRAPLVLAFGIDHPRAQVTCVPPR